MKVPWFWVIVLIITNVCSLLVGLYLGSRAIHTQEYLRGFKTALFVTGSLSLLFGAYKLYKGWKG